MDTPYSPEFIASQKQALLEQKASLENELAGIAKYDEASGTYMAIQPELDGGTEDSGDSGMESEIAQTNQAMVASLESSLAEVNHALSKMDNGRYGVCEQTGDFISEERLTAYPAARTCSDEVSG